MRLRSIARSLVLLVSLLMLNEGCNAPAPISPMSDMDATADMTASLDMSPIEDMISPSDIAATSDMTATPDMTVTPDMTMTPDMTAPADLSIAADLAVNPCSPNPCQNAGTCTAVGMSYACACAAGYSGATCSVAGVKQIATGFHACALLAEGDVKCWGSNLFGSVGSGVVTSVGDEPGEMGAMLSPVPLGAGRKAKRIAVGIGMSCAILDDDSLKCWGRNEYGQLGQGDTNNRGDDPGEMADALASVSLGTGRTVKDVVAGSYHACAILDDGSVKCWGRNSFGQLGLGDTSDRGDEPGEMGDGLPVVSLGTGRTAKHIAVGNAHTCAILDNNSVKCWGQNHAGYLGQGDTVRRGDDAAEMGDALPPVELGSGRTAKHITCGTFHTCVILDDNSVKCWGRSALAELGYGDVNSRGDGPAEMGDALPTVSLGLGRTAKSISSLDYHTCVVLDDDAVKCWGVNTQGQLGQGDTIRRGDDSGEMGDALASVSLGTGRVCNAVAAGLGITCTLLDDNTVKCWGTNGGGELGQGDTDGRGDGPGEMGDALMSIALR